MTSGLLRGEKFSVAPAAPDPARPPPDPRALAFLVAVARGGGGK